MHIYTIEDYSHLDPGKVGVPVTITDTFGNSDLRGACPRKVGGLVAVIDSCGNSDPKEKEGL